MKSIEDVKILVIGDIMLDKYVVGNIERISPEFPVPVLDVTREFYLLGGSGNVVRNIAELGVNVHCLASVGNDEYGLLIAKELEVIGAKRLLFNGSKITTVKERIIADHRKIQMLRVDREHIKKVNPELTINMFKSCCDNDYDMIIISDYAKGMISHEVMKFLKEEQDIKIIVDPKPNHIMMYNGVYMITPNEKEWGEMLISSSCNLADVEYILETKGKDGMTLIDNQKDDFWDIKAEPVSVYNVSGAGDVVVAMMAVCLSHGLNILDSAYIANKCAEYTVTQPQTCVVPKDKFQSIYKEYFKGNI